MGNLFKCQLYTYSDVSSSVNSLTLLSASESATKSESSAKSASECSSEQIVQNVVQIAESAAEVRSRSVYACMSELVVLGLLVSIAEDRICLSCLLELLLGFLVARILVRVVFDGQFSIGLLYFLSCGILAHAQHFIIISFCHIVRMLDAYNNFCETYYFSIQSISCLDHVEYFTFLVFFRYWELGDSFMLIGVKLLTHCLNDSQSLALKV